MNQNQIVFEDSPHRDANRLRDTALILAIWYGVPLLLSLILYLALEARPPLDALRMAAWTALIGPALLIVVVLGFFGCFQWGKFREERGRLRVRAQLLAAEDLSHQEFARSFPDSETWVAVIWRHALAYYYSVPPERVRPEQTLHKLSPSLCFSLAFIADLIVLETSKRPDGAPAELVQFAARLPSDEFRFTTQLSDWTPPVRPTVEELIRSVTTAVLRSR